LEASKLKLVSLDSILVIAFKTPSDRQHLMTVDTVNDKILKFLTYSESNWMSSFSIHGNKIFVPLSINSEIKIVEC